VQEKAKIFTPAEFAKIQNPYFLANSAKNGKKVGEE